MLVTSVPPNVVEVQVPGPQGPPGSIDVPTGGYLVMATESEALAIAHPEYAWLILEPAP